MSTTKTSIVALAQVKPKLGDVAANLEMHEATVREAKGQGADVVVFPELSLTGYHLKDDVAAVAQRCDGPVVARLAALADGISIVAGLAEETADFRLFNSVVWMDSGRVRHVHRKVYLPTYGMFDEHRYFARGGRIEAFDAPIARLSMLTCEDMWHPSTAYLAALDGALAIVCPSASPARGVRADTDHDENAHFWELLNRTYAQVYGLYVIYVNRVGFEDGVGFWGGSEVIGPSGEVCVKAPYYETALVTCAIDLGAARRQRLAAPLLRDEDLDLTLRELTRIRGTKR